MLKMLEIVTIHVIIHLTLHIKMTTSSEKIHPFCSLHYTDAIKLPKLIYMIETFCPEFVKTWENVKSGDTETWEEYRKIILEIADDGRTIKDQLNWSEKNEY